MEIRMSGILRKYVGFRKSIVYDAPDLQAVFAQLCTDYPQLTTILFDSSGHFSRAHRVFLNGEQIEPGDLSHQIEPDDSIDVLTSIAGGGQG